MSIVIFHPSTAPFVQQAARALWEANLLERFFTTLRDNPTSPWQRLACGLARGVGRDLRRQLARRAVTEIPAERVVSFPLREIARLASGPLDRSGRLTDRVWEWAELGFDRKVSRQLSARSRGVYGFEHSSLATFTAAHAHGQRAIYDVPAPETLFVQRLLRREMDQFPCLRTAYHDHTAEREARRTARRRAEWELADVVIANSQFTRRTYVAAGLDGAKIHVVPYGAPPPAPRDAVLTALPAGRPLQLIWAGTFGVRKGAHYLLEAWRRHRIGRHARLRIHGAITLPDALMSPLPDGVEIGGSIPRDELMAAYQRADVLIFPTLCDGFGLVVTEAFSRGLPVITTDAAGAADLVREKENGLLIPAANVEALAASISWCLEHRAALRLMREPALETAARHQWSDYRRGIVTAVTAGEPAQN